MLGDNTDAGVVQHGSDGGLRQGGGTGLQRSLSDVPARGRSKSCTVDVFLRHFPPLWAWG